MMRLTALLAILALLASASTQAQIAVTRDQLEVYLRRGESGLTRAQVAEAILQLGFYAGRIRATRAMTVVARSLGQ